MQIAIDGPAGSGKSTIAKLLANELNIIYLDTGAMYRAITDFVIKNNINLETDLDRLKSQINDLDIKFKDSSVFLNNQDITTDIRSREVTNKVSEVSAIDFVRESLTRKQQEIAENYSVVMDGRDIGTTVLPNADFKFYLDATPECRAQRRASEVGISLDSNEFEKLKQEIIRRDYLDSHRELSPLKKPDDAVYIITDKLTIPEVLNKIKENL